MSVVAAELNAVIIPLLGILMLFVLPIRILSQYVSKLVLLIEKPNVSGITVLAVVSVLTSIAFLYDFLEWQSKYSRKHRFPDISLQLQNDAKRLRLERNIYIHIAACALSLSVKKIAQLISQNEPKKEKTA